MAAIQPELLPRFSSPCFQNPRPKSASRLQDKLIATGVVKEIKGKKLSPYRLKDGVNRVRELAEGLLLELFDAGGGITSLPPSPTRKLLENNPSLKKKSKL